MPNFWCVLKKVEKLIKAEISRLVPSDTRSMRFLGVRNLHVYNPSSDIDGDRPTITLWGLMTYVFRKKGHKLLKANLHVINASWGPCLFSKLVSEWWQCYWAEGGDQYMVFDGILLWLWLNCDAVNLTWQYHWVSLQSARTPGVAWLPWAAW